MDHAFHPWSLANGIECGGGKAMARGGGEEEGFDGEEEDWGFDDDDLQGKDDTQVTCLLTGTWGFQHTHVVLRCVYLVRHESSPPWGTMYIRYVHVLRSELRPALHAICPPRAPCPYPSSYICIEAIILATTACTVHALSWFPLKTETTSIMARRCRKTSHDMT